MTTQKAYERIREYFSRPGAVLAMDVERECVYRLDEKKKSTVRCAVGCLIPDSRYDAKWEGKSADLVAAEIPSLKGVDVCLPDEGTAQSRCRVQR